MQSEVRDSLTSSMAFCNSTLFNQEKSFISSASNLSDCSIPERSSGKKHSHPLPRFSTRERINAMLLSTYRFASNQSIDLIALAYPIQSRNIFCESRCTSLMLYSFQEK